MAFHAGDVTVGLQIGGMTTFVSGWKAAVAVVAKAASAMVDSAKSIVTSQAAIGDEIQKMAQRIDFSTEALSSMRLQLELNGASLGDLQTAMRGANRVIDQAARGMGAASSAIGRLGIEVKDLQGLTGEQTFNKLAEGLSKISHEGTRAALAQEIFGRSAQSLLPYINNLGSDAGKLAEKFGTVWSQEQANEAAYFNDILRMVGAAFEGMGKAVAVQLMPHLSKFFAGVAAFLPIITEWVTRNINVGETIDWLGKKWREFWLSFKEFGIAVDVVMVSVELAWRRGFNEMRRTFHQFRIDIYEGMTTLADGVLSRIEAIPGGRARDAALKMLGVDVDTLREVVNIGSQNLIAATTDLANVTTQLTPLEELGIIGSRIKETAEALSGGVADIVLSASDNFASFFNNADETFRKMMGSFSKASKSMETEQKKTTFTMNKNVQTFVDKAADGFASLAMGAEGSFGEIVKSSIAAAGAMAIKEGIGHILGGAAMLFAPGQQAAGKMRMKAGVKLAAWGAVAAAVGRAGAGSDAGASTAPTSDAAPEGDLGDRTGPGYEVDEGGAAPRQQVQVVVQGSMFDSRETWVRMSELAREHSDADITITQAALGRV